MRKLKLALTPFDKVYKQGDLINSLKEENTTLKNTVERLTEENKQLKERIINLTSKR